MMYLCTRIRGVAQPGSASQWGCGGRWFESSHSDECKAREPEDIFRLSLFFGRKRNAKRERGKKGTGCFSPFRTPKAGILRCFSGTVSRYQCLSCVFTTIFPPTVRAIHGHSRPRKPRAIRRRPRGLLLLKFVSDITRLLLRRALFHIKTRPARISDRLLIGVLVGTRGA